MIIKNLKILETNRYDGSSGAAFDGQFGFMAAAMFLQME
jgi:hypothetical protein